MTQAVLVRYPEELIKEVDKLVEKKLYTSRSDALKDAARQLVRKPSLGAGAFKNVKPWQGKTALEIAKKKMRKDMWDDLMERANGDEDKAFDLLLEDLKKEGWEKI